MRRHVSRWGYGYAILVVWIFFFVSFEISQASSAPVGRVFVPYLERHPAIKQECGLPVTFTTWHRATATQRFHHRCTLTAHFTASTPTPKPSPTAIPRPLPTATPVPPTPAPVNCTGVDCAAPLLAVINHDREQHGRSPLTLDATMSNGSGACIGALGHSEHMAAEGYISHDQFPGDVCASYTTAGENVGMASGQSTWQNVLAIHAQMMGEPWTPGCTDNHACNLSVLNPAQTAYRAGGSVYPALSENYTRIGIGIYVAPDGSTWLTEDFAG